MNCLSANATNGEHRLAYEGSSLGGEEYICLNCGETIHQFVDSHGG